jgi:hypothetical protein
MLVIATLVVQVDDLPAVGTDSAHSLGADSV